VSSSEIAARYNEVIDRQSAYEMLTQKIVPDKEQDHPVSAPSKAMSSSSITNTLSEVAKNPLVKQVARELTRGIFGVLFGKTPTRRR
jgi:hypothetical protein